MFILNKPLNWNDLSFSNKIQYYMSKLTLEHSYYVDKLVAKQIVKDICNDLIEIPKTIRILKNYTDIVDTDINPNYIIKSSHGSSWNININSTINKKYIINKLSSWNCKYNPHIEKQYSYISPRFYIEEKLICKYNQCGNPYAFCLYCLYGKVFLINVVDKELDYINHYNLNWDLLDIHLNGRININKPEELDKMIILAEKLSLNIEFVRVDFYVCADNKIYFSEFTFSPLMGANDIYGNYEIPFGKLWT